jgi:hypothetical protein
VAKPRPAGPSEGRSRDFVRLQGFGLILN